MFDGLTPEMWQLIAVLSTGGFPACFTTTGLLLWRHRRQQFEWLLNRKEKRGTTRATLFMKDGR